MVATCKRFEPAADCTVYLNACRSLRGLRHAGRHWTTHRIRCPHRRCLLQRGHHEFLVAERIHFTLFGIILPTVTLKVYRSWCLWTQRLRMSHSAKSTVLGFWLGGFDLRLWGMITRSSYDQPKTPEQILLLLLLVLFLLLLWLPWLLLSLLLLILLFIFLLLLLLLFDIIEVPVPRHLENYFGSLRTMPWCTGHNTWNRVLRGSLL